MVMALRRGAGCWRGYERWGERARQGMQTWRTKGDVEMRKREAKEGGCKYGDERK